MRRLTGAFLLAVVLLCLGACSDRVTRENFDRIQDGMARERVIDLLGEPDAMRSMSVGEIGGTTARWESGGHVVIVLFADDRVVFKSYGRAP